MLAAVLSCVLGASAVSIDVGPVGSGVVLVETPGRMERGMTLQAALGAALHDEWVLRADIDVGADDPVWSERYGNVFTSIGGGVALLHRWALGDAWRPFLGGALSYRYVAVDRRLDLNEDYDCPNLDCDAVKSWRDARHVVPQLQGGLHAKLPLGIFAELASASAIEAVQGRMIFEQRFTLGLGWSIGFGGEPSP